MKRMIYMTALVALVGMCAQAGPPTTIQFAASAGETNTSAVTTYTPANDLVIHGFVEAIILDVTSGALGTGTVSVATLASQGTGPSRSLLSIATISADGVYPVRDLVTTQLGVDIAATPTKIPLVADKLRLQLYNWDNTTNTVAVWVVITPEQ